MFFSLFFLIVKKKRSFYFCGFPFSTLQLSITDTQKKESRRREKERESRSMTMASWNVGAYQKVWQSITNSRRFSFNWFVIDLFMFSHISSFFSNCSLTIIWQQTPALDVTCRKKERDRDRSYPYKVIEITPPPKNLGIRCFPPVSFSFLLLFLQTSNTEHSCFGRSLLTMGLFATYFKGFFFSEWIN